MDIMPHDLLRIRHLDELVYPEEQPSWVALALERAPYVVVRRARVAADMVAVGIRGHARNERSAALLPLQAVVHRISPESLVQSRAWETNPRRVSSPILRAFPQVADLLTPLALTWGPTGSAGFELASGMPTTRENSDLDLILRAPQRFSRAEAQTLLTRLASLPVRVDVQVETPSGAFVLREYGQGSGRVLLRISDGPRFVQDPWAQWANDTALEDSGAKGAQS